MTSTTHHCPCGCGELVVPGSRNRKWATAARRTRGYRASRQAARVTSQPASWFASLPSIPGLKPSARRVLVALQNAGEQGATTAQLCQPGVGGVRFGARIAELRAAGVAITARQLRPGSYRYRLVSAAQQERDAA